jgi:hypothetical protein
MRSVGTATTSTTQLLFSRNVIGISHVKHRLHGQCKR